jgi:hypothetical protein
VKHYTVSTRINDEQVGWQEIDDPFILHTVDIGWRDLLRALIRRRGMRVVVNVSGDRHATFHVMQPIPLLPDQDRRYGGEESVSTSG